MTLLTESDEYILKEVGRIRIAYQLKRTLRYASSRDHSVHTESVAEHVFGLIYLARYFLLLEDPERKLDREKISDLLLFHDFGEITHGDVPYHFKTRMHEVREEEAATDLSTQLPYPLQEIMRMCWFEYKEHTTPEARFAYALDKIEPLFELYDPVNETSFKRLEQTYEQCVGHKLRWMEHFPYMRRFTNVITTDMKRRGVFHKAA